MSIIYNVNIEPAGKKNLFLISWHNQQTKSVDSFTQETEITSEEI
jgi:hypothetical protein